MTNILPVTEGVARSFFTTAIREVVMGPKFVDERSVYGFDGGIDYVAGLLLHSAFFGAENPWSIWGENIVRASEISEVKQRLERGGLDDQTAQALADRILLLFGFFHWEKSLWPVEAFWLKNYGGELYERAARVHAHEPPLREQLVSMAGNVLPWAEVLQNLKRRESILIELH